MVAQIRIVKHSACNTREVSEPIRGNGNVGEDETRLER